LGQRLFRIGLAAGPECPTCPLLVESPQHVLMHCPAFAASRAVARALLRDRFSLSHLLGAVEFLTPAAKDFILDVSAAFLLSLSRLRRV
jgi:hypothetical protein